MTLKPCPRCKKLIPCGMAYCEDCKPLAQLELQQKKCDASTIRKQLRNRKSNQYTAFYRSPAWRKLSKAKLSSCEWKCEAHIDAGCTGTATDVHHIKPIQTLDGWELRLDWDNLEAVCVHCHNLRHGRGRSDILDLTKLA